MWILQKFRAQEINRWVNCWKVSRTYDNKSVWRVSSGRKVNEGYFLIVKVIKSKPRKLKIYEFMRRKPSRFYYGNWTIWYKYMKLWTTFLQKWIRFNYTHCIIFEKYCKKQKLNDHHARANRLALLHIAGVYRIWPAASLPRDCIFERTMGLKFAYFFYCLSLGCFPAPPLMNQWAFCDSGAVSF